MSDELVISGGGSFSVATEEMLSHATTLLRAADMTRDIVGATYMVDARLSLGQLESLGVPTGAALAEDDLVGAQIALENVAHRAERLSVLVRYAAQTYGVGEAFSHNATRQIAASAAAVVGFLFPAWATAALLTNPVLPLLAALGVAAFALGRANPQLVDHDWVSAQLNEFITDPTFVLALRHTVMTTDEFTLGASGIPPNMVAALSGAGLIGLATSARSIQQAGGLAGVLKETPVVQVSKTVPVPVTAPKTMSERVSRIPQPTAEHPEQIRIEKYETPGELPRFEVYIAGTQDFALSDTTEPWDSTSNVSNAAGPGAASVAAVASAMRAAGVTSETPVSVSGHSQGAATAAQLAASGEFNTQGVFAAGGNTGQIPIPSEVPTVIVEHTDDLVVASGGLQDNRHALIVERQAFEDRTLPGGEAVPAHQLAEYADTARLMDESDSAELTAAGQRMAAFGSGAATATVTSYHYERVVP